MLLVGWNILIADFIFKYLLFSKSKFVHWLSITHYNKVVFSTFRKKVSVLTAEIFNHQIIWEFSMSHTFQQGVQTVSQDFKHSWLWKQIFIFIFPSCLPTYSTSENSPLLVLLPDCLRVQLVQHLGRKLFWQKLCFLQVLAIKFWIVNCNQALLFFFFLLQSTQEY